MTTSRRRMWAGDAGDADQQAILDSLHLKSDAETRRRRRQEMEAQHAAEKVMFAYLDEVERDEPEPSYVPVHPAPDTDVVDTSGDEY